MGSRSGRQFDLLRSLFGWTRKRRPAASPPCAPVALSHPPERLETRDLFALNITADVNPNEYVVTDDNLGGANNDLTFGVNGLGQLTLTTTTTSFATALPITEWSIAGNVATYTNGSLAISQLKIAMSDGNDTTNLAGDWTALGVTALADVLLYGGLGNDQALSSGYKSNGKLLVDMSDDVDTVSLSAVNLGGELQINTGDGDDTITLTGIASTGKVVVDGQGGTADKLTVSGGLSGVGAVQLTAENIDIAGPITNATSGGLGFFGDVRLTASTTLSDSSASAADAVFFSGDVSAAGSGFDLAVAVSGSASTVFSGGLSNKAGAFVDDLSITGGVNAELDAKKAQVAGALSATGQSGTVFLDQATAASVTVQSNILTFARNGTPALIDTSAASGDQTYTITSAVNVQLATTLKGHDVVFDVATYEISGGAQSLTFNTSGANSQLVGLAGTGSLIKQGVGTLTVTGIVGTAMAGLIDVQAGTLVAKQADSLGTTAAGTTVADGAFLKLDGAALSTAEAITLAGTLEAVQSATVSGAVTLTDDAVLTGTNASLTVSGKVSGGFGLTTNSTGANGKVVLSGDNDYTGATLVSTGVLEAAHANALGTTAAGTTVQDPATLRFTMALTTNEAITLAGTLEATADATVSGAVTLTDDAVLTGTNASLTVSGKVSGGFGLTTSSTGAGGKVVLSGDNDYTGATLVSTGVLEVAHANALGTIAGGTTVQDAVTLRFTMALTTAEAITLGGTLEATADATVSGAVTLTDDANLTGTNAALTLSGTVSGGFGLTTNSTGANGKVVLSRDNDYTGATLVSTGVLEAAHANALGTTAAGTTVDAGATLRVANVSTAETITLAGTIEGSGTAVVSGAVSLTADAHLVALAGGTLTLSGPVSGGFGFDATSADSDKIVLSGNNGFTGAVTVLDGVLEAAHANALGTAGGGTTVDGGAKLVLNVAGVPTFTENLTLKDDAVLQAALSANLNGGLVLDWTTPADFATIDLVGGATLSVGGVVSGTGGFHQTGAGTLSLSNANTFDGAVDVASGGVLLISNSAALGDPGASAGTTIAAGATLQLNGAALSTAEQITLAGKLQAVQSATVTGALTLTGAAAVLEADASQTLTIDAAIGGTGFQAASVGTGEVVLTQANTFTGAVDLTGGTLEIQNSAGLGTTAAGTTVGAGTTLQFNGAALSTAEQITLAGKLQAVQSATVTGALTLSGAAAVLEADASQTLTIDSVVSGTAFSSAGGALGAVVLTKANTFTGDATITGNAVLEIRDSAGLGTGAGQTILNGAAGSGLVFGGASKLVVTESIQIVANGNLSATNDVDLTASSLLNLAADAAFNVSAGKTFTLFPGITETGGARSLTLDGGGTLLLAGDNAYTGTTDVDGGVLEVSGKIGSASTKAGAVTVGSGAVLRLNSGEIHTSGDVVVAGGGTLSGAGQVDGSLQVDGTVAPGLTAGATGILQVTGDLGLNATSVFNADLTGPVAGTGYDQIQVAGAATIAAGAKFVLNDTSGASVPAGTTLRFLEVGGALAGTFNDFGGSPIAEASATTVGAPPQVARYSYNNFGDFVLQVVGPASPVLDPTGGDYLLRQGAGLNTTSGDADDTIEIWRNGVLYFQQLLSATTTITLVGTGFDETLTIDQGGGNFLAGGGLSVDFQGGAGGNDRLGFVGGGFLSVDHALLAAGSGTMAFNGTSTVTYSGLEAIHQAASFYDDAGSVVYPDPTTISAAGPTIATLTFNTSTGDDQALLADDGTASNGISRLSSLNGGFTQVDFANPTLQLDVFQGTGTNSLTVSTLTSDLSSGLRIDGQASSTVDSVLFTTNYTSTPVGRNVVVESATTTIAAGGVTLKAAGEVTLDGKVVLDGSLSIDTSTAASGTGDVLLGGTVTASAAGKSVSITAENDVSLGSFDASGGAKVQNVTITTAHHVDAFGGAIDIAGAFLQSSGDGNTTFGSLSAASVSVTTADISFQGPGVTTTGAQSYTALGAISIFNDTLLTATILSMNKQVTAFGDVLTVDLSDAVTGSTIVGIDSGTLVKNGGGKLTITGDNTGSTADVQVKAGTVVVSQATGLGSTATGTTTVDSGAVLVLNASIAHDETINLAGTLRAGGAAISVGAAASLVLTAPAAILDNGGNVLTIDAVVSESAAGNGFQTAGAGTVVLTNANTFTGASNVAAGTLDVRNNAALGTGAGQTTVAGGATLLLNSAGLSVAETVNLSGTLQALQDATLTAAGGLVLNVAAATIDVAAGTTLTVDSVVSGTGGFQRTGTGALILTGANTFDGKANITAGTVELRNDAALGDTGAAGDTTVAAGASLVFNSAGLSVGETITLAGALQALEDATLTTTGTLTLVGTTTIDVAAGKTLQIDAAIGGAGGFQETGGGTLVLTNANSFAGKADVTTGVLEIRNGAALGATGAAGDTTVAVGATLVLNGASLSTSETINLGGTLSALQSATLAAGGGLVLTSATSVVDVAASQTLTIDAVVSGTGGLVKNGTGQVTLTGLNTYDGATAVDVGKFTLTGAIGNDAPAGAFTAASGTTVDARGVLNAAVSIQAGATLSATGALQLGDGSAAGFDLAGAFAVGAHSVVLRDSDGSSATGTITIDAGTLRATSDGSATNGLALGGSGSITGRGLIDAQLSSAAGTLIEATLPGGLILGDGTAAGVDLAGALRLSGGSVVLRDSDGANLADVTLFSGSILKATTDGVVLGGATISAAGTLRGNGVVDAATVTVDGTISPDDGTGSGTGVGKITFTDDLTIGAGGFFLADLAGPAAGADYDQIQAGGVVTITAGARFILSDVSAATIPAGTTLTFMNSDASMSGTFNDGGGAPILSGTKISVGAPAQDAYYFYDTVFGEFVLQVAGPASVALDPAGGDYLLRQSAGADSTLGSADDTIQLWRNGSLYFQQILVATTSITLVGSGLDDTLTIEQGNVEFLAGGALPVDFQGGSGNDRLGFVGGTFATLLHDLAAAGSGTMTFDGGGTAVTYSGLEFVHQAASFYDDAGGAAYAQPTPISALGPVVATLTFQLSGAKDEAALEDDGTAANSISQLRSTSGTATFTTVAFRDPALQLNVLLGDGDDDLTVSTLASNLSAGLLLDGEAGAADSVAFASSYASTTSGQNIAVTAEKISVSAVGAALAAAGDVTLQGKLVLGGDLSIDTSTAAAADGQVTFSGGVVTASTAGNSLSINAKDDVSFGGAFDATGGAKVLNVTITSAVDVAANVAIDIAGALLQSAGTGTTTLASVDADSASITTNNIVFNGPGVTTDGAQSYSAAGAVTLAANTALVATQVTIDKQVTAAGNQLTLDVSGLGSDIVGVDSGTLVKLGAGTVTISGDNTGSTADVQAQVGTLVVSQTTGLGSTAAGTTTVDAGAVLVLNASIAHAETINLAGTLRAGASISIGAAASLVLTDPVAVLDDAGNVLTVDAVVSGTGGFQQIGGGELVLNGINTYDGATTLTAGKFALTGEIGNGGAAGLFTAQSGVTASAQGTINAPVSILSGASVTATGALVLGDSSAAGVVFAGSLAVGAQTVTLRDSDGAVLANTTISGGTLAATTDGATPGQATISVGGTFSGAGAFTGDLVVSGTVSPDDGTGTANTTGVLTVSGNLTISAGGTFAADVNGATFGTQYDQIQVGGTVTLAAGALFSRTDDPGLAFAGGEVIRLITSATPITGTFNAIPEAAATTIGGKNAAYSYLNLDDFVIQVEGAATVTLAGGDYLLRQNGAYLQLWHGGVLELQQLFSLTTGVVLNGSAAAETVTIDQGAANFLTAATLTGGVNFGGGAGVGDFLGFVGGNFTNVAHNLTGVGTGSLDFEGNLSRVVYSGLETVHQANNYYFNAGNATPSGQSTAGPTIQNLKFQLPATSDAASLQDDGTAGNNISRISAATFTTVDFANPVQTLTVLAGAGNDSVSVNTLASDLTAGLTIDGEAGGADVVDFTTAYNVATATAQNLTVAAETVTVQAAIGTTTGGAVSITASILAQVTGVGSISTTPAGATAPGAISVTATGTGAVAILGAIDASAGPAGAGTGATGGTVSITAAAGNVTIGANVSSNGGTGATGGVGGSVMISSATGGVLGGAAATVSANGGAGTTAGGAGGSIVVSAGALNAPNLSFSAVGGAGPTGGAGGSANLAADGAIAVAAVSTSGGNGSAGNGGQGGTLTIGSAAADTVTTGVLNSSGGSADGTGATGGAAGVLSATAAGAVNVTNVFADGGAGSATAGGGAGAAVTVTSIAGLVGLTNVSSAGGSGVAGGAGGAVQIVAETTLSVTGTITSTGGSGSAGAGGAGGLVTLGTATTDSISAAGAIDSSGGDGTGAGFSGGAGGGVTVLSVGDVNTSSIDSSGGDGTGGANGGAGGAVSVTSSAAFVGVGSVSTVGGDGAAGGAGAAISLVAETNLFVGGTLFSAGGDGSAGSGGGGGLVTLGNAASDTITATGAIDASGGDGVGAGFSGGKAGGATILATGAISLTVVNSTGGGGTGGANGGAGAAVSVSSTGAGISLSSVQTTGGDGAAGGAGAAISLLPEGILSVTGFLSSAGGAGSAGSGGGGGLVTLGIATTDSISVNLVIDATGGDAAGAGFSGGAGGGATILASGSVSLTTLDSSGGVGAGGAAGGAGGAVSITSGASLATLNTVLTAGGSGTSGGAGAALSILAETTVAVSGSLVSAGGAGSAGSGGSGGLVTVGNATTDAINVTGAIDASGGDGVGAGKTGGAAGGATLLAVGAATLASIDSSGGVGSGGANGGAGGAVSVTSSTASTFLASVTTAGGNGTAGGAGAALALQAETILTVTGSLTATGGDGSAGNGGAGGLVTLGHATTATIGVVSGTIDSSGGSAAGAGFVGGAGGGALVTAAGAVLLADVDASGGVGSGGASGGAGGAAFISSTAASVSLANVSTFGGAGANGGAGAALTIQAAGGLILVTGALVSAGGDGSAGNGGAGGAVLVGSAATTSLNVVGGIDASGGSAVGGGKIGGQAGGATLVSSGLVLLSATIDSSGGDGTGGASGGAGKSVSISSTTNSVSAASVDSSGGNGAAGGAGAALTIQAEGTILVSAGLSSAGGDGSAGSGGKAGLVTLGTATTDSITVNSPIDAGGGTASGGGQNAGGGGGATILAVGAVALSSVDSSGGAGSAGANGGAGGAVSITSSGGGVTTLGVTSAGGTGANGGAGQALNIQAEGAISVTGDLASSGGVGTGGAGGAAGALTLGSAATDSITVTGSTSAQGGGGTTVGSSGAAVSALAAGAITLHLVTASGGDRGGSAGSITIDSAAGPVAVDSVLANGGAFGGPASAGAILLESGAGSAGTINLNGDLSAIARAGGAASSITVNGALVLNPAAVKVSSFSEGGAGGAAVFNGTVDSGTASSALTVVADGGTVFARQVGATKALDSLVVSDASPFTDTEVFFLFAADAANASVRTLGNQTYNDVLILGAGHSADTRLLSTGGAVFLNKDVAIGGGSELFLDTAVQSQFNGATLTLGGVGADGALTLQNSGAATSGGTTLQGNGDIAVLGTNQPLVVQGTVAPGVNNAVFSDVNRDWIGEIRFTGSAGGSQTLVLGAGSVYMAELAPSQGGSEISDRLVVTNGLVVVQGSIALRIDMDTAAPFPPLDIEIPLIVGSVVQTVNNFDVIANGQTFVDAGVGGAFEFTIYDFDGQVTPDSGVLAILNLQYLGNRVVLLQQRAPEQVDLEVPESQIVPQVPLVATLLIPVDRSLASLRNEQLAITGGGVVDPKTLVDVEILELPDFRYASDEADPGKDKQVRVVLPRQTIRMEDLVLLLQKLAEEPFGVYRITISYVDKKGAKPQVIEIAITAHNRDKIRRRLQSLANLQELNLPPDLLFADEVVLPNVEAPPEQRPNRPDEAPSAPAAAPPAAPATGGEAAVPLKDASAPGRTTSLLDDFEDDADEMVQSFAFFGLAGLGASLLSKTDRSRRKRNWEGEIDAVMDRLGDARSRK